MDTGTKLIINKNGIWSRKFGLVVWENIFNYQFEKRIGKTVTYNLKLDTQNHGKLIVWDITYLNTDFQEIEKAIEVYLRDYNIQYLGLEEYES